MCMSGYLDPHDPRLRSTAARVRQELGVRGLLYRYLSSDGLPPGEGAFVICSFWSAEYSALSGRLDEAMAEFERVLGCANDLHLLSEEIEPYLLREQYIVRSPRGRVPTPRAYTLLGRKPKVDEKQAGLIE